MAPLLDAGAAKAAQNCPQPRFDGLQAPETVQNWAVPRFSAALRLVDAGCSHDVDVHQDAQLHGPWDARKTAEKLRRGFKEIGLEFLIPEGQRSNCLTALKLPSGISYDWLHNRLKENGFVIYAGQDLLREKIFRIANMGNIQDDEFNRCLKVLKECFTKIRQP